MQTFSTDDVTIWIKRNSFKYPYHYLRYKLPKTISDIDFKKIYTESVYSDLYSNRDHFVETYKSSSIVKNDSSSPYSNSDYLLENEIISCEEILTEWKCILNLRDEKILNYFQDHCTLEESFNYIETVLSRSKFDTRLKFDTYLDRLLFIDELFFNFIEKSRNPDLWSLHYSIEEMMISLLNGKINPSKIPVNELEEFLFEDSTFNFFKISDPTLSFLKENNLSDRLTKAIIEHDNKVNELIFPRSVPNRERWHFNDNYCTSCMNDPCICSDPEKTSIFWD